MILQALVDYYQRKSADPEAGLAESGFEWKEIPYIVVLNYRGEFLNLESTYEGEGKSRRAKLFSVPKSVKRAANVKSNLLWDNPVYTLGFQPEGKEDRAKEQHQAFVERLKELTTLNDEGVIAVLTFLKNPARIQLLSHHESWSELTDSRANVSFKLAGETGLICDRPAIRDYVSMEADLAQDASEGVCLVTGEESKIERLHPAIKGVWGAQSSGANIVSFNLAAASSYNRQQGDNAPVGTYTAFAYTTALNYLLKKGSPQRLQVGDTSTVFWASAPTPLESSFQDIFGEPPKSDPDRGTRAIRDLINSVENGVWRDEQKQSRFYVLGLAPNASRISIRYWKVDTVSHLAGKIVQHFKDLEISSGIYDAHPVSLFRLLVSTAALQKAENIPPNLAGDTMRAILEGLPYPLTLLQAAVRRNRAEQNVTYHRAALIKACLNRKARYYENNTEELKVSLDRDNTNTGYRLGRLFATLERIQSAANPGINATIRDRYYGAASGTPVAVFSNLMRLKNHHLAKLEVGLSKYFEKLIGEIMQSVQDFPAHLTLEDQGRFAIGYYHQMQDFYTKKNDRNNDTTNTGELSHE